MVLIIGANIDRGIGATGCWSPVAKPHPPQNRLWVDIEFKHHRPPTNAWRAAMALRWSAT